MKHLASYELFESRIPTVLYHFVEELWMLKSILDGDIIKHVNYDYTSFTTDPDLWSGKIFIRLNINRERLAADYTLEPFEYKFGAQQQYGFDESELRILGSVPHLRKYLLSIDVLTDLSRLDPFFADDFNEGDYVLIRQENPDLEINSVNRFTDLNKSLVG